ncbi:uncharacterized protein LOC110039913 [Orbicella faveolata]|uniref:uncharacterized protein LOC110039913 n=1 Tax=Orbicella faveolata TaxID=48498 RepID=UPI0009E58E8C|nr:uncharacterized protein LOC110039913 [Orbicella faveolata]
MTVNFLSHHLTVEMKKTVVTSCVLLLLISSLLLVDSGILAKHKRRGSSKKRFYRDGEFEALSEFVTNNSGERELSDQEFRRNICLSARELDCERELQDQLRSVSTDAQITKKRKPHQ